MTTQTQRVPALRFPGFSGEWEEEKLDDSINVIVDNRGRTPPNSDEGIPLIEVNSIGNRNVNYGNVTKYVSTDTYKNWFRVHIEKGDVLFSTVGNTAMTSLYDGSKVAAVAQNIVGLRFKDNRSEFMYYVISESRNNNKFKIIQMVAVQPSVKVSQMIHLYFLIPTLLEQQKIASFLSSVDTKVEQLTKKIAKLEKYKKGMMQKLFSQEIRFKDGEGKEYSDWEGKPISEVLTIGSGKDYKHLGSGNIPVYGTGGFMRYVDDFLYDGESVCIGRKGTIDKPMFLSGKFWTVDTLFYTHSFVEAVPRYVYYVFQGIDWKSYNEASGVPSLSKRTIDKIVINVPSPLEQQKIADFLSSIDNKIERVGGELGKAVEFKKGLLQKMFV